MVVVRNETDLLLTVDIISLLFLMPSRQRPFPSLLDEKIKQLDTYIFSPGTGTSEGKCLLSTVPDGLSGNACASTLDLLLLASSLLHLSLSDSSFNTLAIVLFF